MEKGKLGGVVFPLVTPFCGEDEHVNYPALDKLIDFLIENGAAGVIPCGSTGELVSMTLEEQLEINRHTIEYVNHRCKVYACTGAYLLDRSVITDAHDIRNFTAYKCHGHLLIVCFARRRRKCKLHFGI